MGDRRGSSDYGFWAEPVPDPTKLRYERGANTKKRRLVGRSAFQKRPALVRG